MTAMRKRSPGAESVSTAVTLRGSRQCCPARISRPARTSATWRAIGPSTTISCDDSPMSSGGTTVAIGITPTVGLSDVMPQQCAGLRSEPPMSLPIPIGLMPDAMVDASPPLDPPAVTCGIPRVAGQPVELRVGVDPQAEVGQVRAGERDGARRPHALDGGRIDRRDRLGEGDHAVGGRRAGHVDVLLHAARHAVQRTQLVASGNSGIGLVGGGECLVGEQPDDGVEMHVALLDAGQVGFDHLAARCLTAADRFRPIRVLPVATAASLAPSWRTHESLDHRSAAPDPARRRRSGGRRRCGGRRRARRRRVVASGRGARREPGAAGRASTTPTTTATVCGEPTTYVSARRVWWRAVWPSPSSVKRAALRRVRGRCGRRPGDRAVDVAVAARRRRGCDRRRMVLHRRTAAVRLHGPR